MSSTTITLAPPSPTAPASSFTPMSPAALPSLLADPHALILDIRPHNAYAFARLPRALSLSVPSTLLKRPNFSLARIADMLPSASARTRFPRWRDASAILVYDADSAVLHEGANLLGLLRKFRNEGFPRDRPIAFVKGGFHAVWRERPELVVREPPAEEQEDEDERAPAMTLTATAPAALRPRRLPAAAFTASSFSGAPPHQSFIPPTPVSARPDPFSASVPSTPGLTGLPPTLNGLPPTPGRGPTRKSGLSMSAGPRGAQFALRLPMGNASMPGLIEGQTMTTPITHAHSLPTPSHIPSRSVAFNPFFDTIRQNLELAHSASNGGPGVPLRLPRHVRRRVGELPFEWLRRIARRCGRAGTEESEADSGASGESNEEDDDGGGQGDYARTVRNSSTKRPGLVARSTSDSSGGQPPESVTSGSSARMSPGASREDSANISKSDSRGKSANASREASANTSREGSTDISREGSAGAVSRRTPESAESSDASSPEELTRALAEQFHRIEVSEQRRLMGVMEHHSKESGMVGTSRSVSGQVASGSVVEEKHANEDAAEKKREAFPYSIIAGVEKGAKNRYRNIWPFEHARVRLPKARPDDDDYMNASYVQPLGTTKRYIATQGPLPATFDDFWTLCWEQNVHVIVMLTREVEGATVKCGKYWAEGAYGPLRLKELETTDTPERERRRLERESGGGFFHMAPRPKKRKTRGDGDDATIRRVFELTNTAYPRAPPRRVTQLQYLEWPDLNVPDNPRGVLELIREVDDAVERSRRPGDQPWGESSLRRREEGTGTRARSGSGSDIEPTTGIARRTLGNAPVLLHCSAGVGRTGGFIAVDAVLDGVRREMRKRREMGAKAGKTITEGKISSEGSSRASSREAEPMEVDASPRPPETTQPALTVPVSVGRSEVHVPVAGFGEVQMDVDDTRPFMARAGTIKPRAQAPQSLADQLRRTSFGRNWTGEAAISGPSTISHSSSGSVSGISSRTDSDAVWTAVTPMSSQAGSATSLSSLSSTSSPLNPAKSKVVAPEPRSAREMAFPADALLDSAEARTRTMSLPVGELPAVAQKGSAGASESSSSRLDTWRSEVRTSAATGAAAVEAGGRDEAVGLPRRLHDNSSPLLLSTYDEPIRRVVEDMREQRMSLCQSLRQYVFVHRAIIEGALMIVDEERAAATFAVGGEEEEDTETTEGRPPEKRRASMSVLERYAHGAGSPFALRERQVARKRSAADMPIKTKRGPSPSELPKEDRMGGVMLGKRPSLKRRQRAGEGDGVVRYAAGAPPGSR